MSVLHGRLLEASIGAYHGGLLRHVKNYTSIEDGINRMIRQTVNGESAGFLLDKMSYLNQIEQSSSLFSEFRMMEKEYDNQDMHFGALLRNQADFEFFESYFKNNEIQLEAATRLMINRRQGREKGHSYVLDPNSDHFLTTVWVILGVIGVITLFGLLYEIRRRNKLSPEISIGANNN